MCFLLSRVLGDWLPAFTSEQRGRCFDCFFHSVPVTVALPPLLAHLVGLGKLEHKSALEMDAVRSTNQLLARCIVTPERILECFRTIKAQCWEDTLTQLMSIPIRAANAAGAGLRDLPSVLLTSNYFRLLAQQCVAFLQSHKSHSSALDMSASVLSRVTLSGHPDIAISCIVEGLPHEPI